MCRSLGPGDIQMFLEGKAVNRLRPTSADVNDQQPCLGDTNIEKQESCDHFIEFCGNLKNYVDLRGVKIV